LEVEIIVRRKKNNPWMAGTRPAMTMVGTKPSRVPGTAMTMERNCRRVFPERP
jgi:hypothetical protein